MTRWRRSASTSGLLAASGVEQQPGQHHFTSASQQLGSGLCVSRQKGPERAGVLEMSWSCEGL